MIYFAMRAFNAERTLPRAIESILAQTCGDFRFHVCDNGSQDGTGEIIRKYAGLDKRVIPFFNRKNRQWEPDSAWNVRDIMFHLNHDDWFSVLDADDDFTPDFLEEMLGFAKQEKLDFAACRSNHILEPEGICCNEFVLKQNIVVEGDGFGQYFPDYFRFMGARWGKLQKGEMFQNMDGLVLKKWANSFSKPEVETTAFRR